MKKLLKNGFVYNAEKRSFSKMDILIDGEYIENIEENIEDNLAETTYCNNKYILPGGVDVHTHLDHDLGNNIVTIDDFKSGTKAALYGGTTSIVDHVAFGKVENSIEKIIGDYHEKAKYSCIDYSFHGVAFKNSLETLKELLRYKDLKISSVKIYTVYDEKLEDKWIIELLNIAKKENIVVCVHSENEEIINFAEENIGIEVSDFPKSRPDLAEAEMVTRLLYYSKLTNYPKLYFVHVSSKESMERIIEAKNNGHKNLYAETCTQYLIFDDSVYDRIDGGKYICSPPIRKKEDVEFLWNAIEDDYMDVIATDHCSFDLKLKVNIDDYRKIAGGVPGIEERFLVILTEAENRNIDISKVIEKMTINPSKIFNLRNKGELKVGKDADIVILDKEEYKFGKIHGKSEYSLYKDMALNYSIDSVIIRGNFIIREKENINKEFIGEFIER